MARKKQSYKQHARKFAKSKNKTRRINTGGAFARGGIRL